MCKHSAGYNIMELHVSVIILCVVSIGTFATVNGQVDVRLSGGQTPFEGRVEVRRNNGEWIFICAMNTQQWNLMEARTVCKQLGFVDVMWLWKNSEFGVSVLPVSACNISCDVSSTSLDDCTIYWIDSCTCTAMYQAGVTCYFPGFRGRYKEKDPMRVFPVSTKKEIPASEVNIPTCINICREQGKSIAVLSSADECYCGDENTEYWRYGEAIPGEMINEYTEYGSQQCSGDTGTDPYKQACAGDWQFDVYDTYIGACGGDYTTDTGYIYSPNFPGLYPPNHSCIWTITVSDNNIIELSILMMKLSSGDFLTIRDGNVHSTILLNYTGINSYEGVLTVNSSSNALWLQFFSNHSSTDKGFVIAYQDTSLQLCTTPTVTDHLIISSAHHSDIFNHGDVITFTCKSGYGLIGERLISCQDDGQWSNNIPTCTAVSCGVPPSFSNAYHTHTDYTYPNTVYYQCVDGYYHSGSDTPNKQCMDTSSWSVGIEPKCTCKLFNLTSKHYITQCTTIILQCLSN